MLPVINGLEPGIEGDCKKWGIKLERESELKMLKGETEAAFQKSKEILEMTHIVL